MATRNLIFVGLIAVPIPFVWGAITETFRMAIQNEAYTHLLLVLPISAALIYTEWPAIQRTIRSRTSVGYILLSLAFAIALCARFSPAEETATIGILAVVIWWIGSFICCFGAEAALRIKFPLVFLVFLVPFPPSLLDIAISWLQHESARTAAWFFRIAGVPVREDGVMLSLPNLDIEVAKECSSIRSSMLLLVITCVLANLFLRSAWRKALLIVMAIPMSVAKNGFRIFTIGELGTRVDPSYLDGRLHHNGGVIFLGIGLAGILVLLWLLRWPEKHSPVSG